MATIALKEGDFGGDVTVTVGETAFYLPDRSRPGLNEMVPLSAVAEIVTLSDDRSAQLKAALRFSARGFLNTGNPLGLAAGVFAVTKVKDVEFSVRLKDGRKFVATADAGTLATLRGACNTALVTAGEDAEAAARADAVIAKYIGPEALPTGPETPEPSAAAEPQAGEGETVGAAPAPDKPGARRVFGRRGVR